MVRPFNNLSEKTPRGENVDQTLDWNLVAFTLIDIDRIPKIGNFKAGIQARRYEAIIGADSLLTLLPGFC